MGHSEKTGLAVKGGFENFEAAIRRRQTLIGNTERQINDSAL
jgi:hypothetical protein